jgi:polyphosphate kinase 2 (PPK2 family)
MALLQNRLWAESKRSVLLVLQGLDASGKDGTIRSVFSGINPQGCKVVSFKDPSTFERSHDYLWRVYAACPGRGQIGIFNRSHYEDVVTVRVRGLAPEEV